MKQKQKIWMFGVIAFTLVFIASSVIFKIFDFEGLPSQFFGALIGVVITAIITVFLLQGQTANEEVYHTFLEELKKIIQDGEITIVSKGKDSKLDKSVDELKDLIFQLGYLQMHTSEKTITAVLEGVAKIIQLMNDFDSTQEADKQKALPNYYSSLSEELFNIVATLKADLYKEKCQPINKDQMNAILKECDLFVETKGFNKYETQKFFWDALQNQLQERGYQIKYKDFTHDINEYYARARNRHRYYKLNFNIYSSETRSINFTVEIDNRFYFGFHRGEYKKNDELIKECVDATKAFTSNDWWYGYRHPSEKYDLDFWNLKSKGFEEIKNPRKRDAFIEGLVNEMEIYIKKFVAIAKEKNL
jgi:hypothetical protein